MQSNEKRWGNMLSAVFGCAVGTIAMTACGTMTDGTIADDEMTDVENVGVVEQAVGQSCTTHSDCESAEICANFVCTALNCTGCTFPDNHSCNSSNCGPPGGGGGCTYPMTMCNNQCLLIYGSCPS